MKHGNENLTQNIHMLKPGVSLKEPTFNDQNLSYQYQKLYRCEVLSVGLYGERPLIALPKKNRIGGSFDYKLEAGRALCSEALISEE